MKYRTDRHVCAPMSSVPMPASAGDSWRLALLDRESLTLSDSAIDSHISRLILVNMTHKPKVGGVTR